MKAWICLYLCNFQLDFSMTPTENVIDKNVLSKSNIRSAAFTIYGTLAMLCKKKEAVILLVATTNTRWHWHSRILLYCFVHKHSLSANFKSINNVADIVKVVPSRPKQETISSLRHYYSDVHSVLHKTKVKAENHKTGIR